MTTKAAAIDDPFVRAALQRLDHRLRERFGAAYGGLILFGSRARGDHAPDGDADVAVVMRTPIENRWRLKSQIIDETYPILFGHRALHPAPARRGARPRQPG
jgi:uncharacterized protein